MKTKLYWTISILAVLILVFSVISSANANQEVRIFKPSKSFISNNNIKDIIAGERIYKRIIADEIDEKNIKLFKNRGCLIKHRLKHSASFECPQDVITKLSGIREARIFHLLDLEADQQIKADSVWAEGITGQGVNVVVLDSGVDSNHIELSDSILGCENFVTGESCEDLNGHGTHVAGIITANGIYQIDSNYATGVAPGAGIYMLKVCNADGICYEDDMMAAMEYALNLDAKIMSISIGGGNFGSHCDSDPLAAKVNWVVDNGFTVAVAAGNEGRGVSSPACASKAIAVGAVDKNGIVPWWSNRGSALDILAPGVDILSTYSCLAAGNCNYYWYAYMSGTSMSSPHVSGIIALLLQTKLTLTDTEIKNALYATSDQATKCYKCTRWSWNGCRRQSQVTCTSDITGAGIVNAYEAYLTVKPVIPACTIDADCDDGLFCNGAETCVLGVCQAGISVNCSGLNDQCNVGVCDEAGDSCMTEPANEGLSCDDGLFCNVGEICQAGVCSGGSALDCSSGNECLIGLCDESTDSCTTNPVVDGATCDDSQFCTVNEVCTSGICSGAARDCSDGVSCTVDSCDESIDICTNSPDNSLCDNGLFCDGTEICDSALDCQAGTPVVCDDSNACTTDSCNGVIDACEYMPIPDCTADTKCWSAEYEYLIRSSSQARKFCKCAADIYNYKRYSSIRSRADAYYYIDSGDNENWATLISNYYRPIYRVKCTGDTWYYLNQDYFIT